MVTMKEAIRREIAKIFNKVIRVETCEVVDVQLHSSPGDQKENTVDVQLRDASNLTTSCQPRMRYRVPVFNGFIGHLFGWTWNPLIGDLVQVLFLSNEKAYVIAPYYNQEQKPICRQNMDDKVIKFCKRPNATYRPNPKCPKILHIDAFDDPDHPVCIKFFGEDRSFIIVSDCPTGNSGPDCDACSCLDSIPDESNSIKFYPFDHAEHPNRLRVCQKNGQTVQLEDDGSVAMIDSVENYICLQGDGGEGGIIIKDKAGSFIALDGQGNLTCHAASSGVTNLPHSAMVGEQFKELELTEKQAA